MIKVKLPWSGEVELEAPDSSICLIKDRFSGSSYGWIIELLSRSTRNMEYAEAKIFWSKVAGREASLALFLLAKHTWGDDLNEVDHFVVCEREHRTDIDDLDWGEFQVFDEEVIDSPEYRVTLSKPLDGITSILGRIPNLDQLLKIESELDDSVESALNNLIRMTCKGSDGKVLSLAQIQKISLVDRNKIKKAMDGENHVLIDTTYQRKCGSCHRRAHGILNLKAFF